MKFISILSYTVFAGIALAAPHTSKRSARRKAAGRHSQPNKYIEGSAHVTNDTNVEYSSNWSGAALITTGVTSVTGTFTVPKPSTAGSGSAWVGIDGYSNDVILQTGVDWTKSGNSYSYDAWYEWYPDYAYDFSGITIAAGDEIKVTVTATSTTSGTAVVENLTTGVTVTKTFKNEGSLGALGEISAEWIVEDFEENDALVTFTDFGSVEFTDASAVTSAGTVGVTGATIIDIKQGSTVLTTVTLPSSSEVLVT
ncbi:protease acp1 [Coleophoma cylindrospora]|uniref:Protease acp1 n=1 Tax=Coleophoma cylindrospora TaxID=1849047 RepID=A0A3D8QP91_9HELO|nr:protease acp1 [Coleophoma cylindrospora]